MVIDERRRDHWEAVHTGKGADRLSWYQAHPDVSLGLIEQSRVGKDARIIDVGGGTSRLVDLLLERGYEHLTVLDIAEKALEMTRARLARCGGSKVTWIQADITEWEPGGRYDVWHDRAVFHFLTAPSDREAYRARLASGLKADGHLIIGTFALDGPARCSGLPVVRYSPGCLSRELGNDFTLVESTTEDHYTPGGVLQRFQFSRFVHRPASS